MILYMFSGIKRYCNLKLFRKQQEQEIEIFSGIKTENQNVHECLKVCYDVLLSAQNFSWKYATLKVKSTTQQG